MGKIRIWLKLFRVNQYTKNCFVFASLLFSNNLLDLNKVAYSTMAYIYFCLISSAVYIVNDIADKACDCKHPLKKYRPIASGAIKVNEAYVVSILFTSVALLLSLLINVKLFFILLLYLLNNILYSLITKTYALIDVFQIAFGFILRVIAGSVVINVTPSSWILLCTLFLSLFLGFGKRRGEVIESRMNADNLRKSLNGYTLDLLDEYLNVSLICTIVFYAIYTIIGTAYDSLYITNVFVVFALFRYKFLLSTREGGMNPSEMVFSDVQILISIILWTIFTVVIVIF